MDVKNRSEQKLLCGSIFFITGQYLPANIVFDYR